MSQLRTGPKGIEVIKHYESLHDGDLKMLGLQPKMDPIGIWTEGYGRAMLHPNIKGQFLKGSGNKALAYELATIKTEAQAEAALKEDIIPRENTIFKLLKPETLTKITPDKLGAIVSFVYNCGTHYKAGSKMVPFALWKNLDDWAAGKLSTKNLFDYWCNSVTKAGGKILNGLVYRRKSEAMLFCYDKVEFYN